MTAAVLLGSVLGSALAPGAAGAGWAALVAGGAGPERPRCAASVTITGHGNGHGIGLSQYGAYGYAVDAGWTAAQILARYYGGTVAGSASNTTMSVRLQALDDGQTAIVQPPRWQR